ncbi:MAG TPA: Glu-tRNA(Gln) amidotransferase subunit GatD [Thermoplasmata archaeon]|nr:Glu-tRNA(Gln) amidotransferase subunit GatD [Thermoplasmata archaeon]
MARADPEDPWERLSSLPTGRRVEITGEQGEVWSGSIVPRSETTGERILQLKLDSGYNVGIRISPAFRVRELDPSPATRPTARAVSARPSPAPDARIVTLLTSGGTIASRVDYETGGVRPVKEETELLAFYPELESSGSVRVVPVMDRLSEDLVPHDWVRLAEKVVEAFEGGARGVVIAHGTDTLAFTSSALSFLLADLPGPVVVVGAQRSPDRPSSDGASNLSAAVRVAREEDFGEVVVVMHAGLSDGRFAIHRGTWVRKMHSSRRDAFQSRNGPPLGFVDGNDVRWDLTPRPVADGPARVDGPISTDGALLWSFPGLSAERAEGFARGLRGLVLAGTGLGHVSSAHLDWIRRAIAAGQVIAMTTQCLEGNADPFVYSTGRELQRAGVVYLGDLLPETAYAKLLWALGHSSDPKAVEALLLSDVAGEFHWRHLAPGGS